MMQLTFLVLLFQPETAKLRQLFEGRYVREHTPEAARDFGLYLARHNDPAAAQVVLREALRLSGDARDALELALVSPAAEAEPLLLQAAKNGKLAPRAFDTLGHLYDATGNRTGAAAAYRKAIALHPQASTLEALSHDVDPLEAVLLLQRALAINRRELGSRHPQTATTEANLAGVLLNMGRTNEAIKSVREAMSIFEESLGPEHPRTAQACTILAFGLKATGDRAGAERFYRRALAIDHAAFGPNHSQTLNDQQVLDDFLKQR